MNLRNSSGANAGLGYMNIATLYILPKALRGDVGEGGGGGRCLNAHRSQHRDGEPAVITRDPLSLSSKTRSRLPGYTQPEKGVQF